MRKITEDISQITKEKTSVLTYSSKNPFGLDKITFAASIKPRAFPPFLACCCTVLIVSNGASAVFEQAAAKPEAIEFLIPLMAAEDVTWVLVDVDFFTTTLLVVFLLRIGRQHTNSVIKQRTSLLLIIYLGL